MKSTEPCYPTMDKEQESAADGTACTSAHLHLQYYPDL